MAVDDYLAHRGLEKQYRLVEQNEHAIQKIIEGRQGIDDEDRKATFTELAYLLMENPNAGVGRLYEAIPRVAENLEAIVSSIDDEVGIEAAPGEVNAAATLLGATQTPQQADAIERAARDEVKKGKILSILVDAVQEAAHREKQDQRADYCLRRVKTASAALIEAKNSISPETRTEGIEAQLLAIEGAVAAIRERLAKYAKNRL
jgi:hypothetical protein